MKRTAPWFATIGVAVAFAWMAPGWAGAQTQPQTQSISCGGFYQVERGDTLREIAIAAYGEGNYEAIFDANTDILATPQLLLVGQQLFIPCLDGSGPRTRAEAEAEDQPILDDAQVLRPPEFDSANLALPATLPQIDDEPPFFEGAGDPDGDGFVELPPRPDNLPVTPGEADGSAADVDALAARLQPQPGTDTETEAVEPTEAPAQAAATAPQRQPSQTPTAPEPDVAALQPAPVAGGVQPIPPAGGIQPTPAAGGVQPGPAAAQPQPTVTAALQPAPAAGGIQPTPAAGGIQPTPAAGGIQPTPAAGGVQPGPAAAQLQPTETAALQPAPAAGGIQPGQD
ncbi:MAG: hypothetical protein ACFBRM_08810 [Pikeienuella sp.]